MKNKNEILAAEIQQCHAHILYWQTHLLSGAYADDVVETGTYGNYRQLKQKELRDRVLGIISTQCDRIGELVDSMDRIEE